MRLTEGQAAGREFSYDYLMENPVRSVPQSYAHFAEEEAEAQCEE